MNLVNKLKYAGKKIIRDKKNIFLIIFLTISTLVILGVITYREYYLQNMEYAINKNIASRTLSIDSEEDTLVSNEEILKINHVLEIYRSGYGMYDITTPTYTKDNHPGMVELLYGSENTLPQKVIGEKFTANDTGVAICPMSFYPWNNNLTNIEYEFLDGKKLLNTTFDVEKEVHKVINGKITNTGEIYKKTFKIIGLYNHNEVGEYPFGCYISASDMKDLYDHTIQNENVIYGRFVIIDDMNNSDYVRNELQKLGLNSEIQVTTDPEVISFLKNTCNFIVILTIIVMILISFMYIHKKSQNDLYDYGILKAVGYQDKEILKINILEVFLISIISYLIGITIFELIYQIIKISFRKFIIFNTVLVKHFFIAYLLALLIILVIPTMISYLVLYQKIKSKPARLLLGQKNDN